MTGFIHPRRILAAFAVVLLPIAARAIPGAGPGACFDRNCIESWSRAADPEGGEPGAGLLARVLSAPAVRARLAALRERGFAVDPASAVVVRVDRRGQALARLEGEGSVFGEGASAGGAEHRLSLLALPLNETDPAWLLEFAFSADGQRVVRLSVGTMDGRAISFFPGSGLRREFSFPGLMEEDPPQASPGCTRCVVRECLWGDAWCSWATTLLINCGDCWSGVDCRDCFIAIAHSVVCNLINCDACADQCSDLEPPVPIGMTTIPAGIFIQGDGGAWCGVEEREVTLTHDFFLATTEVTNEEYRAMLQWAYDQGYVTATVETVTDALGSGQELVDLDDEDCEITFDPETRTFGLRQVDYALTHAYPLGYDPADHPVKKVTWYGAASYCDWLSLAEGLPRAYDHWTWICGDGDPYLARGYRLPTDAEWEYAAQWNDERIFPWGDEVPTCSRANFHDNGFCVHWTSPVGSHPAGAQPNLADPIHDLSGNIFEWVNDRWECSLGSSPETDPQGPRNGSFRVLRGGSWHSPASFLHASTRYADRPGFSSSTVGFRLAKSVGRRMAAAERQTTQLPPANTE